MLQPFSVRVYDSHVDLDTTGLSHVVQTKTALDACNGADVLTIMTPWPEYSSVDLADARALMNGRAIIDPYGAADEDRCMELGFSHFRMGSPARVPELVG